MVARDVRVEPLVGGMVVLLITAYFSFTQITGLALIALVVLSGAFALQILYAQVRITGRTVRNQVEQTMAVKRSGRARAWSLALLGVSGIAVLASVWFLLARTHFQALVCLSIGAIFLTVAILGLRASIELRRSDAS